jgi:hypothetical protein
VLTLMAEGRSNAGIATALVVSAGVVEKHVASIFGKLGLPPSEADNRRVLAVLRYLGPRRARGRRGRHSKITTCAPAGEMMGRVGWL